MREGDTMPNNHAVSTFVVTIVHPREESPTSYAAALADAVQNLTGNGTSVSHASSVGTYIETGEEAARTGADIPDWVSP